MENLSLIKTIIRNLRFIELPELKGQQIRIHDIDTIETTLRTHLATLVTDDDPFPFNQKTELRLAKYDLIDAAFLVSADRFAWEQQHSMATLKSWGFFRRDPDKDFLEEFVEEVTSGETYLRIMLKGERYPNKTDYRRIPTDYFPRTFTVEAACVSNGTFIWYALNHFYL